MTKRIHSAELMTKTILASPELLLEVKERPEETLKKQTKQAIDQTRQLQLPTIGVNDAIWLIIVISFAISMVLAVLSIINVIPNSDVDRAVTIFTTVVAFLAGLLSPSPLGKGGGSADSEQGAGERSVRTATHTR